MKKEIWIFIIVLFMCIGAVLGILCYNKLNISYYALNLPSADSVYNIKLEQNGKSIEIVENEKIKDIVDAVVAVKRTTKDESMQDSPINVENEIKIDFEYSENKIATIFVYEKKDKYYIEQPYNGIYRISPEEYNSIEKYFRDSEGNNTSSYVPDGMDIADENDIGTPTKIQNFNRSPENVTIEILEDTITNESAEILITDNNQDHYGWGADFRVQKKS